MKFNFIRFLRSLFFFFFSIFGFLSIAQVTSTGTTGNYTQNIDAALTYVNKTPIATGILYDRVMSFADLDILKEDGNITTSNYQHFIQSWGELYRASYNPTFVDIENLKANIKANTSDNIVDIGIINTKMNYIDYGLPTKPSLTFTNNYFYNVAGINPFLEKQVTVIAPLKERLLTGTATFRLQPAFMLQKTGSPIKNLVADFGTGTICNLINNGVINSSYPTVRFSSSGTKTFVFAATFNDNTTETLNATMEVSISPIPAIFSKIATGIYTEGEDFIDSYGVTQSIPFQGYNETSATSGTLEYRTYYNTVTNTGFDANTRTFSIQPKLRKEILILDGFDPGDKRKIYGKSIGYIQGNSLYESMIYDPDNNPLTDNSVNFVQILEDKGYDVTLVNFQNGSDYIERSAMALVALLQRETAKLAQNGSAEKIVIMGPSMGGLVSRYALAYMEKNNLPHNTRLWISFDTPHLGANIPISAQETLYFFGYKAEQDAAKVKFDENFRSPAARQMLIEQLDYKQENAPYPTDLMSLSNNQTGQNNNTSFRQKFMNNLNGNGLQGSNGFPQNLRKIAIVNGTTLGTKINSESQMYLELAAFKIVKYGQIFGTPIQTKINVARIEDRFLALPNSSVQTSYNKGTVLGNLSISFLSQWQSRININPRGSMDIVPSGLFNTQGILKNEFDTALIDAIPGRKSIEWRTYVPNHAFIPTVSSLALKNPNFDWSTPLNRNLICDSNNKEIPFDSYFAPSKNEDHVSLTTESATWLLKELGDFQSSPSPQAPWFPIDTSNFTGPNIVCLNTNNTYSFSDVCKLPSNVTWSLSSNLQTISSTGSNITVRGVANGQGIITATFSNGQTFTKKIWVGTPVFAVTQINNPNYYNESHFYLDGIASTVDQGVTQIKWTKISSTSPTARLYASLNETEGFASGVDNSWSMDVKVEITNSCGTSTQMVTIMPPASAGCDGYSVAKSGSLRNAYRIIDPCLSNSVSTKTTQSSKLTNITIEITDVNGKRILQTTGLEFALDYQLPGVYYLRIIKNGKVVHTQTLIKN